jgi:hypothetical protein
MVFFSDVDEGTIWKMDTIEYKGKMWLVPEWTVDRLEGLTKPTRIICLDSLQHQKTPGGPADFVLNNGIPKSVVDTGQTPPRSEDWLVVIENPDITVEGQTDH